MNGDGTSVVATLALCGVGMAMVSLFWGLGTGNIVAVLCGAIPLALVVVAMSVTID